MKKLAIWSLAVMLSVITYGAMYADAQNWLSGRYSHTHSTVDHVRALAWAIFPPMWIIAPIFTNGYEHGLQFRHHHKRFCNYPTFSDHDCEMMGY